MASVILVILVIIPGVCCGDLEVIFESPCALKGQSLVIPCSFDYPEGNVVTSVSWARGEFKHGIWRLTNLNVLPSYQSRVEYLGNKAKDCTLRINNIRKSDEGAYFFRFETRRTSYRSGSYVDLSVKELTTLIQPTTVTEGEWVRLSCLDGCTSFPLLTAVWFRDGQPVTRPNFQARVQDAGSYHCAVRGQETIRSDSVALNVYYGPKKVTLSASSSGNVVKGSSVTFTCSSDAKPAVTESGYSLYKDAEFIKLASGKSYTIHNIQPSHSGLYHCRASNGIKRDGIKFPKSADFNLDVQYRPENISVSVDPPGHVAEGSSVNLTCSSAANPAVDSYTWYRRTGSPSSVVQVGSGQVLSLPSLEPSQIGLYLCQARNPLGENSSTELLLEMQEKEQDSCLPTLVGVGVTIFVALVVALVILWFCRKKRKTHADKHQPMPDSCPSGRGLNSSDNKEEPDSLYANFHFSSSSPLPPAQDLPSSTGQADNDALYENGVNMALRTQGEEIAYSTITVKPMETLQDKHTQSKKPRRADNAVIYATLSEPSRVW